MIKLSILDQAKQDLMVSERVIHAAEQSGDSCNSHTYTVPQVVSLIFLACGYCCVITEIFDEDYSNSSGVALYL